MTTDEPRDLPALLQVAKQGELNVLNPVFEAACPALMRTARQLVSSGWRRQMRDSDLFQQTLLTAILHIEQFRGETEEELLSWMVTIMHHLASTEIRRLRAAKRDVGREAPPEQSGRAPDRVDPRAERPLDRLTQKEMVFLVARLMNRLPPNEQEVLHLWMREERVDRIAADLGITPSTAYKRLVHALEAFHTESAETRATEVG